MNHNISCVRHGTSSVASPSQPRSQIDVPSIFSTAQKKLFFFFFFFSGMDLAEKLIMIYTVNLNIFTGQKIHQV